jgi:hypothetical protein
MDSAISQTGARAQHLVGGGWASLGLRSASHLVRDADLLARRRCGCIVTRAGKLEAVYGRWWPHLGNMMQILWDTHFKTLDRDCCRLFYHQPLTSPGYLTLSYVQAGPATSIATLYAAGLILDEIARLRQSNAIVSEISNERISEKWLNRWGWEAHCPHLAGRHFIKRFYGVYPEVGAKWKTRLAME